MLQVAIGISFVFLLLSVIVSAANEILQAWLSKRAKQLEAGIGELLQDRDFKGAAKAFFDHPLISSLSKGAEGRPSYIAARTFVMTLLDLVRKGEIIAGNVSAADLEAQIAKIENEPLKRALTCLFEQANKDVAKFEQALETWFNEAMDRVSGWYKRLSQYSLLLIGLVLAIWANVDTIHIARALSADPKLQADAADAAIAYLKTQSGAGNASGSAANSGTTSTATQEQKQNASPPGTPTPSPTQAPSGSATSASSPTSVQSLETAATELASLQVPLGWADPEYSYVGHHWLSAIAGWLLTALAASMGAPFWFDTLNRFINIRAAGRSPDEHPNGAKRKTK